MFEIGSFRGKNFALFLNVLFMMAIVSSEIFNEENFVFPEENYPSPIGPPYIRRVKLYNYCSRSDVRVSRDRVNAKRSLTTPNQSKNDDIFLMKSVWTPSSKFAFNIISEENKRYICFNKKTKLITRVNGENNNRCIFEEVLSFGNPPFYSEFRSVFNDTLYIGFNAKGRPLLGSSYESMNEKKRRCFYFLKRPNMDFHKFHVNHGPKINPNKVIHLLRKEKLNRKRRSLISSWNSR